MRRTAEFGTRLAGAFVLAVALLGSAAIVAVYYLAHAADERERTDRRHFEDVVLAERLRSAAETEAAAARGYIIAVTPDFLRAFEEATSAFDDALRDLRSRLVLRTGKELLKNVARMAAGYRRAFALLIEGHDVTRLEDLPTRFERQLASKRRLLRAAIDEFVAYEVARLEAGHIETQARMARAVRIATLILVLAVLISALFTASMCHNLSRTYDREAEAVERATRALAARDELLGIVAHDLRSPLTAINARAALLHRSSTEETIRRHATSIKSITMRMEVLIRSLLDTASVESGQFSVSPEACSVGELLLETAETLTSVAASRSIRLDLRVDPHDLVVMADRNRVLQVLINLVGNAIKFSVDEDAIELAAVVDGDYVRFSVTDGGPGIDPNDLPRIFDRFWKSRRNGKAGTGLGLYIARGIVEAHGGRIWVNSRAGRGTAFCFTLLRVNAAPMLIEARP